MLYSKSFIRTIKETPRGANSTNQILLERGSYISQIGSGIFAYLPLGLMVLEKVEKIIRESLTKIGVNEVALPLLNPAELWRKSGRLDAIGKELFRISPGQTDEFVLAMTHEEIITAVAREKISSPNDLPLILGQISKKIRNEVRPRGGLIRLKEFQMQDAYSFHQSPEELDKTFNDFIAAYREIFNIMGLKVVLVEADSGMMGGEGSREFMLIAEAGEDRIYLCPKGDKAFSAEMAPEDKICPNDKSPLEEKKAIELAHLFQLGTKYSESFNLKLPNQKGKESPVLMGCYGLGLDRLIAAVVESSHDENGIIWPEKIAPQKFYLIDLAGNRGQALYDELSGQGLEVLFDDREVSAGVKFADADLLGIPYRLLLSEKIPEGKIELSERKSKLSRVMDIDKIKDVIDNGKKLNF